MVQKFWIKFDKTRASHHEQADTCPSPRDPSQPHQAALPALEGADEDGLGAMWRQSLGIAESAEQIQPGTTRLPDPDLPRWSRKTQIRLEGRHMPSRGPRPIWVSLRSLAAALEEAAPLKPSNIDAALSNLAPILEQALDRLDVWLRQQEEAASMAYNVGDGPPRMEARPTGSGRERSSPNRSRQCRGSGSSPLFNLMPCIAAGPFLREGSGLNQAAWRSWHRFPLLRFPLQVSATVSIDLGDRSYDIRIGQGLLTDSAQFAGLPCRPPP